jgi:hypothetical protein
VSVTWRAVSFLTEKLTEVLIRSFLKTKVSSVMQIEIHELKNKVSKTQGPKRCITFKFILFGWTYIFKIKILEYYRSTIMIARTIGCSG